MGLGLAVVSDAREEARAIEKLIGAGQYREAIARCARAYAVPLGRLCMAFTGSQAESEELVQETLLAAFDGFPQFRGEGRHRDVAAGVLHGSAGSKNDPALFPIRVDATNHDASFDGRTTG